MTPMSMLQTIVVITRCSREGPSPDRVSAAEAVRFAAAEGQATTAREECRWHVGALYQYRQGKITDVGQGGQYTRVYLDDIPFKQHIKAPKQWHGAPVPTIRRAIGALGSPRIRYVPQEMITKLTILRDLYYFDEGTLRRAACANRLSERRKCS